MDQASTWRTKRASSSLVHHVFCSVACEEQGSQLPVQQWRGFDLPSARPPFGHNCHKVWPKGPTSKIHKGRFEGGARLISRDPRIHQWLSQTGGQSVRSLTMQRCITMMRPWGLCLSWVCCVSCTELVARNNSHAVGHESQVVTLHSAINFRFCRNYHASACQQVYSRITHENRLFVPLWLITGKHGWDVSALHNQIWCQATLLSDIGRLMADNPFSPWPIHASDKRHAITWTDPGIRRITSNEQRTVVAPICILGTRATQWFFFPAWAFRASVIEEQHV